MRACTRETPSPVMKTSDVGSRPTVVMAFSRLTSSGCTPSIVSHASPAWMLGGEGWRCIALAVMISASRSELREQDLDDAADVRRLQVARKQPYDISRDLLFSQRHHLRYERDNRDAGHREERPEPRGVVHELHDERATHGEQQQQHQKTHLEVPLAGATHFGQAARELGTGPRRRRGLPH